MQYAQNKKMYVKRLFDIIISACALILLFPLLVSIYILCLVKLGEPVLFKQARPGYNEKIFNMYKFRSMTEQRDATGTLLADEIRLTKFGNFLRKSSLDELPELWNILKGEMSFVGPRPLLVKYLALYNKEQARRHNVKPGLTGWAQVNGRNAITWEEKFKLDIWYVDHWSLWLDFKILLMTVKTVFIREGISQAGHATMEDFNGSN